MTLSTIPMWTSRLAAALALALPLAAAAAGDDAPPAPGAESLRRDGPLMAHLLLTPDEPALRRRWAEAAASGAGVQPRLEITDTTAPGRGVSAVVVFTGCAPGGTGLCDVAVEFALQQRDGTRAPLGSGVLWSQPPHTPRFMLGSTSLKLSFGTQDQGAQLRVFARVTDRVAGRSVELAAPLRVE